MLALLRPDFPDVTVSKIRFLESEGLVCPARTASGYRQFVAADVERLRFVLSAQRDHYLPLKVIKEQLEAAERGLEPATPGPRLPRHLTEVRLREAGAPEPEDFTGDHEVRLTRDELLAESGVGAAMLAELEEYALVRPGPAGFFDPDAVLIVRTVAGMAEHGIEPRHLRAFRASADREAGLLEQIVAPVSRQRGHDAHARATELLRELAALSVTLHTLLVKTRLRGISGG